VHVTGRIRKGSPIFLSMYSYEKMGNLYRVGMTSEAINELSLVYLYYTAFGVSIILSAQRLPFFPFLMSNVNSLFL